MYNILSEKVLQQINYFTNLVNRQQHNSNFKEKEILASRAQAHLLGLLLVENGLTQKDLSAKLQIRPASLGELVNKLQQNGYVEKRVNEKDKRVSNVYITEEGRRATEGAMKARRELVESIFLGLSEEEINQLSTLMDKLVNSIEQSSGENVESLRKEHHGIKEGSDFYGETNSH
ncbi:MarR family transcriptional regulator [Clostridium sp. PL3]|uniref:MarR family transcriptional regulator n=1 Tax=Clostridium thailandense TaxID=2794346 RepID=A0A949TXN9_9CLOT|nr:MarR family transcriptional regulator [Clostridium thailandense]MBV7273475.1 MarR family transcriptional regulator [Clostridium thailandense]